MDIHTSIYKTISKSHIRNDSNLVFCTYFDIKYLSRGETMLKSLFKSKQKFVICVLTLDDMTKQNLTFLFKNERRLKLITIENLFEIYPELQYEQYNRSLIEFYFLLTPFLIDYNFKKNKNIQKVVYIDSDLFFFKFPNRLLDRKSNKNVQIVLHDYSKKIKMLKYGLFNVGWVSFNKNSSSKKILNFWKNMCIYSTSFESKKCIYGDQYYLNYFPLLDNKVDIVNDPIAYQGPWTDKKSKIYTKPDIFHFHGLALFKNFFFIPEKKYGNDISSELKSIYEEYFKNLKNSQFHKSEKIKALKALIRIYLIQ